jgi:hypothetical protein
MSRVSRLLFVSLLIACPVHAQTTANGSIGGAAVDQQGAVVPGVLVSASSPAVPGVYTATTDRLGRYRLGDLPPGDYTITGELAGFARFVRTAVTMRAGLNLVVDLEMKVGAVDETIEVTQDTPLLETERAGQAVNISGELLRTVPTLERREWLGALALAPGVTSWQGSAASRLFSVHGADSSANVVQLDGADISPPTESSLLHVAMTYEAIDDIQIKTAGVDASAPLGQGGIINIASASGTNRVKGAVSISIQPRAWNDSNQPGGTSTTVSQRLPEVSLGAPILKDRLWAFGAYRYTDLTTGVSRTAAQLDAMRALVPNLVPLDSTNQAHFWLAKLTAQLGPRHQLSGFHQRDFNPSMTADPFGVDANEETLGGSAVSARLSSVWSNRLTTRLAASYNDKRRNQVDPQVGKPMHRVYQNTVLSGGRLTGTGLFINIGSPTNASTEQPNSKVTVAFDATLLLDHRSGSHQLQAGLYAQPRTRFGRQHVFINGGHTFEDQVLNNSNDFRSGARTFHRLLMDTVDWAAVRVQGYDYAAYLQDAWRPTGRLTVSAGVRVDVVSWRDRLFDVVSLSTTAVGPRLGVNYALTADARNIVRSYWGLTHDRPGAMAAAVGSTTLGQRDLYDLNLDGTFETVFVTPPTFALTRGRTIDRNLHLPFIRDWGGGYSRQLGGRTAIGVDLVHRDFRDRPALLETNQRYEDGRFTGYLDETVNETYLVTNNVWNWPSYTSLDFSLSRRTQRVQAIASYVRQWRHMSGTWQPKDPASFLQPAAFATNHGIGATTASLASPVDANSLTGTHMAQRQTSSGQWQDHTIRAGAMYEGPWRVLLAGNYTFQSGAWSGPVVTRIAAPDPAFGPTNLTLSNGRVVSNPLATQIRFAYATRGDNQLETPNFHLFNFRVGRRFAVRGITIDAALDVFNATNHDADLAHESGANQLYNPLYGQTAFRQMPRSAQITLRTSF